MVVSVPLFLPHRTSHNLLHRLMHRRLSQTCRILVFPCPSDICRCIGVYPTHVGFLYIFDPQTFGSLRVEPSPTLFDVDSLGLTLLLCLQRTFSTTLDLAQLAVSFVAALAPIQTFRTLVYSRPSGTWLVYSRGLGNSPSAASRLSQLAALSLDALTSITKHVGSCYIQVLQTFGLLQFVRSLTVLTLIPWA